MSQSTPKPARSFLTARWANLALLSYAVSPELLQPLAPPGCELDSWHGQTFVSLVAFDFLHTRVFGLRWPGFGDFPEINLRMYLKYRGRRGVAFIREFVPSRWTSWIARRFYNEPYQGVPMSSRVDESADRLTVQHTLAVAGRRYRLAVTAAKPAFRPGGDSIEHFFKEHDYGFGSAGDGRLIRYRVEHPAWDVYPIENYTLQWDWQQIYGARWAILQDRAPDHLILAAGSDVRVMRPERD